MTMRMPAMKNTLQTLLAISLSLNLVTWPACQKKSTPENALRGFVNYRFQQGQSRYEILDMLDGPLREKVENMDSEAFNDFADTSNLRKSRFIINVKNCVSDIKCFLTYTLSYNERTISQTDDGQKRGTAHLEVKKIAEMTSPEPDTWKIADVTIVKSYVEGGDKIEVKAEGVIQVP